MAEDDHPVGGRVGEQHQAYRRGLVLGLTLAEISTLIIFVLLLLIGIEAVKLRALQKGLQTNALVPTDRLRQLEADGEILDDVRRELSGSVSDGDRLPKLAKAHKALTEISKALGFDQMEPDDDFIRLIRVVQDLVLTTAGKRNLAEASDALQEIKAIRERLAEVLKKTEAGDTKILVQQLEEQADRIGNQEGQLAYLQTKLQDSGRGKGERPCWAQPDGTIDYLFDVVLTSTGIGMREYALQQRVEERSRLPMPTVDPAEILSPAQFTARTAALFRHSQKNNCRFFVVVYDSTAVHEKDLYKSLLRTVEGHFYKLSSNGIAPF